jgi:glycosyltransferase involved in cell wall biosynthesis
VTAPPRAPLRIAGISDVSLGYGSPQILTFMRSLWEVYGGEMRVFEPDQPERPPRPEVSYDLPGSVERVFTAYHPHRHAGGRIEYVMRVADHLNALRPQIVTVFCTYALPVLVKLAYRPSLVIYYSLESIDGYGALDVELNRALAPMLDLAVFPEEHRAVLDVGRCGLHGVPVEIVFNCTNSRHDHDAALPAAGRNGRVLYAGTIDRERTFGDYFLRHEMEGVPIDLYGHVSGWPSAAEFVHRLPASTRYRGHLDALALQGVRPTYAYSVVAWNPSNENQRYAAPNKLFESIAAGVPPIAAPHPQCRLVLDRYGCGLVMDDWEFPSFHAAIGRALDLYGTPAYAEMVERCRQAVAWELSWERQFERVRRHLRAVSS